MRWSTLFIPTLRDAPADAEALSHRLLVRGGFIRQLQSGHYSMLPLGWRVHRKVAEVIRQEMDAIGAQELLLPAMHPASVWQQSGRWESMGDEMFRLVDRKGADLVLGTKRSLPSSGRSSPPTGTCRRCGTRSRPSSATSPAPSPAS